MSTRGLKEGKRSKGIYRLKMARGVENYLLCTKDKSRRNQGNDNGFLDWPGKKPERIRIWGLGGGD